MDAKVNGKLTNTSRAEISGYNYVNTKYLKIGNNGKKAQLKAKRKVIYTINLFTLCYT